MRPITGSGSPAPIFVPDEGVLGMLKLAALSGVDVRILVPERPDNRIAHYAAYAFVGPMLDAGVRIYRYQKGFLHGKGIPGGRDWGHRGYSQPGQPFLSPQFRGHRPGTGP